MNQPTKPPRPVAAYMMWTFGIVAILGIGGYHLFWALDDTALPTQHGTALVLAKAFQQGTTTYVTQVIDKTPIVYPIENADYYMLKLDIDGAETMATVSEAIYEGVQSGDMVDVKYQRRRFTRGLQVVEVMKSSEKKKKMKNEDTENGKLRTAYT